MAKVKIIVAGQSNALGRSRGMPKSVSKDEIRNDDGQDLRQLENTSF